MPYCSSHSLPYSGEGSFYGLQSFKYCSTVGLRPAGCNWGHSHGLFHGLQGTSVPHLEHSCLPALTLRSAGLLLLCFPHTVVLHSFFSLLWQQHCWLPWLAQLRCALQWSHWSQMEPSRPSVEQLQPLLTEATPANLPLSTLKMTVMARKFSVLEDKWMEG